MGDELAATLQPCYHIKVYLVDSGLLPLRLFELVRGKIVKDRRTHREGREREAQGSNGVSATLTGFHYSRL